MDQSWLTPLLISLAVFSLFTLMIGQAINGVGSAATAMPRPAGCAVMAVGFSALVVVFVVGALFWLYWQLTYIGVG